MDSQKMFLSIIKLLCDSGKPMTTDKIATTLDIDHEKAGLLLENLADRSVVNKRTSEEFEDSVYSSNKVTHEFYTSLKPELEAMERSQAEAKASSGVATKTQKAPSSEASPQAKGERPAKTSKSAKAEAPKAEPSKVGTSAPATSSEAADPLIKYLKEQQAPESLIRHYQKVLGERDKSKREVSVWKTSFRELTDSLKKRLGEL